jgi:hypothetical protein
VCPVTEASSRISRHPDAPRVHEVEPERPDPLEQAMQAGLVEVTPEGSDAAGGGDAQAGERRSSRRIELTRDADLVTCGHGTSPSTVSCFQKVPPRLRHVIAVRIVRKE